jgi:GNAT superfamily N-acetyltransferase
MNIRPTELEDLSQLSSFLSSQNMMRSEDELRWKFFSLQVSWCVHRSWIAEHENEIVGHIGVMPCEAHLTADSNAQLHSAWFVDWMVREDMRSRGIGILLLKEAENACPSLLTVQGSEDTRTALPQLNWTRNDGLAVYKLNVGSNAGACGSRSLRGFAIRAAGWLRYHPVSHKPPAGWHLVTDRKKGPESEWHLLDTVFARQRASCNGQCAHFGRGAQFLRWAFRQHPAQRYQLTLAYDNVGPAGYAVWRLIGNDEQSREGRLVDIMLPWDQKPAWRWFVSTMVKQLSEAGATQLTCLAGQCRSALTDALTANRFIPRQTLPLWSSPGSEGIDASTCWHATFADSDIDLAAQ